MATFYTLVQQDKASAIPFAALAGNSFPPWILFRVTYGKRNTVPFGLRKQMHLYYEKKIISPEIMLYHLLGLPALSRPALLGVD